jgi:hypothetical protein
MNSFNPRYDIICDPLDMWIVWDNQTDEPATFGGQILHGLTQGYAVEVAKIMNEIYGTGGGPAPGAALQISLHATQIAEWPA